PSRGAADGPLDAFHPPSGGAGQAPATPGASSTRPAAIVAYPSVRTPGRHVAPPPSAGLNPAVDRNALQRAGTLVAAAILVERLSSSGPGLKIDRRLFGLVNAGHGNAPDRAFAGL